MANFILGYSSLKDNNFVNYTPAASSENPSWPATNLKIYGHRKLKWEGATSQQITITLSFGASKNVQAVFIDDCNFTNVTIGGTAFTATRHTWTDIYKIYAAKVMTASSIQIVIPVQATTDGGYPRIGRIAVLDTLLTLPQNPVSYEYDFDDRVRVLESESGNDEDVLLGGPLYRGYMGFDLYSEAQLATLSVLNALKKNAYLVFYENRGNTANAYLVRRRTEIKVQWREADIHRIQTVGFKEVG